jgi:hypothetical protein
MFVAESPSRHQHAAIYQTENQLARPKAAEALPGGRRLSSCRPRKKDLSSKKENRAASIKFAGPAL